MQVWRICKRVHQNSSFSGLGGLATSGRWHFKGFRIVYTAQSLSLAALESWVHLAPAHQLPQYAGVSATIPGNLEISIIDADLLIPAWRNLRPLHPALQELGTQWLKAGRSAIARVPSAVIVGEFNYLLNPLHPDFSMIVPGVPEPFEFDPRMWKAQIPPSSER